ncbi:putative quinol monooxygenase [Mollicutes bacterium LVI A0078]|nr:putative quinol monooxygenase [Mollicutes bacterium LVI A0075]WOO90742.1 putative quinol monooxygenase [Mollicutes bacterium LVI A0078]
MNEMINNGIVDRIRKQPGNLKYEYFIPFEEEGKILLIDQWSSQHALDVHHRSPMMQAIIDLRNKYELEMVVERFTEDNKSITSNNKKILSNIFY